ncbi:ABC transporter ATP-binding protein [Amycolatopsis sp. NPDC098790]|uniref:ABC transporter ATP-binding protein n=1 Tax=Amycolatopsis sp. NPDC098790 TaxID=3363939 RepID=UPI00380A7FC3
MTVVAHRDLVLDVTGLCKTFQSRAGGAHEALADVSFSVERGSCLAVVGESGSGKTTAARIVAGLETATAGTVDLAGGGRCSVQMVFQDPYGSLDPRQSIGAGLHELLRVHGMRRKADRTDRVAELLDSVGLDGRHGAQYPNSLSGGQRQRVAIARALALEPTLLILDEAVSALDVSVQAQVLNLLADIRELTSITYLFVSHDLGVVRQVSDTCVVLEKGRVVERGRTGDVLDSPQERYTQALVDAVPRPGWRPRRR